MEGVAVGEGPGRRMWAVWARDGQGLRWDSGGSVGEGHSRGLKKLKLSRLNGPRGIRRGQSQRCLLVFDVGEHSLHKQHQDGNDGEEQI